MGKLVESDIKHCLPYFRDHKAHLVIRRSIKHWMLAVFFHTQGAPDYRAHLNEAKLR